MDGVSDGVAKKRYRIVRGLFAAVCIAVLFCVASVVQQRPASVAPGWLTTVKTGWASDTARRVAWAALTAGVFAAGLVCVRMRRELARARAALQAARHALATTGHELRTPLQALVALVDLARRDASTPEQRRLLTLAHESGESLSRLLGALLEQARIEAGRVAVRPAAVEPRVLFDGVLALFAPQARAKGLQLRQRVSAAVPAVLRTDGDRMRQILVNLIDNAIKFTGDGTITLDAGASVGADGVAWLTVTIVDTGGGIADAVRPHLFDPYATSAHDVRHAGAGMGLGLAISRQLATLLDGELTLTSEAGTGTTAALRLRCPVVVAQRAPASLAGRAAVVEHDDPFIADALRAYAGAAGMRVVAPDAAPEAIWLSAMPGAPAALQVGLRGRDGAGSGAQARLDGEPLTWRDFVDACEAACSTRPVMDRAPAGGPRVPADGYRVLIVDDHALGREALRLQLGRLGHRVVECENGRDALVMLESGAADVDLVLTDCLMPVMDGAALAAALRAHVRPRLRTLPVVGLTALAAHAGGHVGADEGMAACLHKPVALDTLRVTLDAVMRAAHRRVGAAPGEPGEPEAVAALLRFDAAALDHDTLLSAFGISSCPDATSIVILAQCSRSLSDDRTALANALQESERGTLRRWCHAASGAFALFRQAHVDALIDRLSAAVARGEAGAIRASGAEVLHLTDHLVAHVERLAASVERANGPRWR